MLPVFDIVEVAAATGARPPEIVMETSFRVGARLKLGWLRDRILELPRNTRWQRSPRAALRDDLNSLVRVLTQEVLEAGGARGRDQRGGCRLGEAHQTAVDRCLGMLADIQASRTYDTTTLPVALREIRNLVRGASGINEPAARSPPGRSELD